MAIIRKQNPVNEDKCIDTIQVALFDGLVTNGTWTNYESYHRAYKNETPEGIRPEIFRGVGNEYWDSFMNDDFNVTSFFLIPNTIDVEDDMHTAIISIIFQANLDKLYPTAPHRFDAEMRNEIENVLKNLDGTFSFTNTHTSITDVYEGLDTSKVQWDDMQKFHVVRFEIEANYVQECEPAFASGDCTIGVTVSTTDETAPSSNDGTATANFTGDQGAITFLWTTSNGSIPAGEEIKQTATGLSDGAYTVVVTDDNAIGCTATGSGTVEESPPPPLCTISIDSMSQTPTSQHAGTDGTASAVVSGNVGAIGYRWSDGQTSQTAVGLSSGNIGLTVLDLSVLGCSATDEIFVVDGVLPLIATVSTWLDASVTTSINAGSPVLDDPIETWADLTTNGYDATQSVPANRPIWKTTYVQGSVNDFLTFGTVISKMANWSVYVVFQRDVDVGSQVVYGAVSSSAPLNETDLFTRINTSDRFTVFYSDDTNHRGATSSILIPAGSPALFSQRFTSNSGSPLPTMRTNGVDDAESDGGGSAVENSGVANNFSLFRAGDFNSQYLTGRIFEFIVYDSELSDANDKVVNDYLIAKYSL